MGADCSCLSPCRPVLLAPQLRYSPSWVRCSRWTPMVALGLRSLDKSSPDYRSIPGWGAPCLTVLNSSASNWPQKQLRHYHPTSAPMERIWGASCVGCVLTGPNGGPTTSHVYVERWHKTVTYPTKRRGRSTRWKIGRASSRGRVQVE